MPVFLRSSAILMLAGWLLVAGAPKVLAQSSKAPDAPVAGWLGVTIQDVTEDLSETLPRGLREGALINGVLEDSPAEEAGLQEGDIVVKIDQSRVRNSADLTNAVRDSRPGHVSSIEYYREGRRMRTEVTLAEKENTTIWNPRGEGRHQARRHHSSEEPNVYFFDDHGRGPMGLMAGGTPRLGVQLMDLSDQLSEYFGVAEGVLITEVISESAAETAGLKAGDVITAVGDKPTGSSEEVRAELGEVESGPVEITVVRHGEEQKLTAELKLPRRSSLSGFHGPSAPMFNIPDISFNQEGLKADMEALKEQLKQLEKELSDLRDESR
jgi:serine protease Do